MAILPPRVYRKERYAKSGDRIDDARRSVENGAVKGATLKASPGRRGLKGQSTGEKDAPSGMISSRAERLLGFIDNGYFHRWENVVPCDARRIEM